MLHIGLQTYGKVDHLPGLFYVETSFIHIQFVPLFPTCTYLVIDDAQKQSCPIGPSGKSILFGYMRAFFVLGCIASLFAAIAALIEVVEGRSTWLVVAAFVGLIGLFPLLWFLSYKVNRPGALRALELAAQVGIPPETVAAYFVDSPELDRLEAMRARQWEEEDYSTFDTET